MDGATSDRVAVPSTGVFEKAVSALQACYRNPQKSTSSLVVLAKQFLFFSSCRK